MTHLGKKTLINTCKVMHMGKKNAKKEYFLKSALNEINHKIESTKMERDLGIIVSADGKWHNHVNTISS